VDELDNMIEEWTRSVTSEEAIKVFETYRIPCGKSLRMSEVHDHPQLRARGTICDQFDFSKWGVKKASIPGPLIKFSTTKGSVDAIGPEFGANNEEIYCDLLKYNKEDLKSWKRKKII